MRKIAQKKGEIQLMRKVILSIAMSLEGYVADGEGKVVNLFQ